VGLVRIFPDADVYPPYRAEIWGLLFRAGHIIIHRAAPDAVILGPFRADRIGQADREIDQLVYRLCGLDADEIKIIEESVTQP
jgi:hypothetical protein